MNISLSKASLGICTAIVSLVVAAAFYCSPKELPLTPPVILYSVSNDKSQQPASPATVSPPTTDVYTKQSLSNSSVLDSWLSSRGTNLSTDAEYESYDSDTLRKLGNTGDIRALAVIANRFASSKDRAGQKLAKAARMKGAVYGSTFALHQQAAYAYQLAAAESTEEKKLKFLLEGMAWEKVGLLRGDPTYYYKGIESPNALSKEFTISDSDFRKIDEMAHRIYSSLESSRIKMGIGAFDNSAPPEVVAYFQEVSSSLKQKALH